MPRIRVPILGMGAGLATDAPANQLPVRNSPDLSNVAVRRSFVRTRNGLDTLATKPDSNAVIKLFSARLEDGSSELFAVTAPATSGGVTIWRLSGGAFVQVPSDGSLANANGSLAGTNKDPWDAASVLGKPIFVNGINENVYWDPAADSLKPLTGNPSRYVIGWGSRTILGYQNVSGSDVVNQVQTSVAGAFNDFVGAGSTTTQLRDDPFPITGLSVTRRLTIYKERSIVLGTLSGISADPIAYQTLGVKGIGLFVPFAFASFGTDDVFLSADDFYTFGGTGNPVPLNAPIREFLHNSLNGKRLAASHALIDSEHGELLFFLAEGADDFPKVAYVLNLRANAWFRWPFAVAASASAAHATGLNLTWQSATGTGSWQDYAGQTWADLSRVSSRRTLLVGSDAGDMLKFVLGQVVDEFSPVDVPIPWSYSTPDWTGESVDRDEDGQRIPAVEARDEKVLDHVDITYQDFPGGAVPVTVEVSTDGGQTHQLLQVVNTEGTSSAVKVMTAWGRISGKQFRVRLSGSGKDVALRDLVLFIDLAGEGR